MAFDAGAAVAEFELSYKELGKSIGRIKKEFKGLETDTGKSVKKMGDGWGSLTSLIGGFSLAYAAKRVKDFAAEAVTQFAKVEQGIDANNRILQKYGDTWDSLYGRVKDASGGVISEVEAISKVGTGLLLGIKPEEIVEMTEIARAAARAMGKDVGYMLESIITGTARQSKLWLDNLGIIIDTEAEYKKYAATLGKTASQLTDVEKKQAFTNAVLEKGRKIVKEVGVESRTLAERIQATKGKFSDLKTAVGKFINSAVDLKKTVSDLGYTFDFWTKTIDRASAALARNEKGALLNEKRRLDKKIENLEKAQKNEGKAYTETATAGGYGLGAGMGMVSSREITDKGEQAKAYGEAIAKRTEVEERLKQLEKASGPTPTVDTGDTGDTVDTSGGGAPPEPDFGADELQALREKFMTEENLAETHYENLLAMIDESNLSQAEKREAQKLAEDEYNQALAEIANARTQKEREAAEEAVRIRTEEQAAKKKIQDESDEATRHAIAAREAEIQAYTTAGKLATQLLVDDIKTQSKILAGFEIAEGTKEFAKFMGTMNPMHLVSSLQHALAAKQYLAAASGAGGSSGGKGGGGGGNNYDLDKDEDELDKTAEDEYKDVKPGVNIIINNHGAVLDGEKLSEWTINELAPVIEKNIGEGKVNIFPPEA